MIKFLTVPHPDDIELHEIVPDIIPTEVDQLECNINFEDEAPEVRDLRAMQKPVISGLWE